MAWGWAEGPWGQGEEWAGSLPGWDRSAPDQQELPREPLGTGKASEAQDSKGAAVGWSVGGWVGGQMRAPPYPAAVLLLTLAGPWSLAEPPWIKGPVGGGALQVGYLSQNPLGTRSVSSEGLLGSRAGLRGWGVSLGVSAREGGEGVSKRPTHGCGPAKALCLQGPPAPRLTPAVPPSRVQGWPFGL